MQSVSVLVLSTKYLTFLGCTSEQTRQPPASTESTPTDNSGTDSVDSPSDSVTADQTNTATKPSYSTKDHGQR
jgi:hypothetical protein